MNRFISLIVIPMLLLLLAETVEAEGFVIVKKYYADRLEEICIPLSENEAKSMKGDILNTEFKYSGIKKINHQINIIYKYLKIRLPKLLSRPIGNLPRKEFLIGFRMIVVHFTPNGCINGTCFPFPPIVYHHLIYHIGENKEVKGVVGILPYYFGHSDSEVYITVIGLTSKGFIFEGRFCPFYEFLLPCSGTSIRVYENGKILFKYNVDICRFGILWSNNRALITC